MWFGTTRPQRVLHSEAFRTDSAVTTQSITDRIRRMMKPYGGSQHTVVAFSLRNGTCQCVGSGPNQTDARWEDLIFEIGSITKVFTAILLWVLVHEGKIDPHAPVSEVSDRLSDVPDWITPERLISHTSGLPNIYVPLWKALLRQRPEGPYAGFSRADLLGWFQNWRGKDPGLDLRHGYSNLGVGLLGDAMAMRENKPFSALLAEKVIRPLGMLDTSGDLREDQRTRFMQPRDTSGKHVLPWTFDALAGAGYLRSTGRDMGCFSSRVIQAINEPKSALDRAIKRSSEPIFGLGHGGRTAPLAQCAGWISMKPGKSSPCILLANGGTAGSTCALYVCPATRHAIAILANNGVAASLWASAKLNWSNPMQSAHDLIANG